MNATTIDGAGRKAVVIRGQVRTKDNSPVSGAVLDVSAINVGGQVSSVDSLGTTTTTSSGAFAFRVKPKGARRVVFSYRPASSFEAAASASVLVRQKLKLVVRRSKARLVRGQSLTLSGKLSGAAAAAAGARVQIEVLNGRKWQAVGSVTASRSGAFAWKHRFTRVTRPTLFTFRAVVRPTGEWPWSSKASSRIKVLVTR